METSINYDKDANVEDEKSINGDEDPRCSQAIKSLTIKTNKSQIKDENVAYGISPLVNMTLKFKSNKMHHNIRPMMNNFTNSNSSMSYIPKKKNSLIN